MISKVYLGTLITYLFLLEFLIERGVTALR